MGGGELGGVYINLSLMVKVLYYIEYVSITLGCRLLVDAMIFNLQS